MKRMHLARDIRNGMARSVCGRTIGGVFLSWAQATVLKRRTTCRTCRRALS